MGYGQASRERAARHMSGKVGAQEVGDSWEPNGDWVILEPCQKDLQEYVVPSNSAADEREMSKRKHNRGRPEKERNRHLPPTCGAPVAAVIKSSSTSVSTPASQPTTAYTKRRTHSSLSWALSGPREQRRRRGRPRARRRRSRPTRPPSARRAADEPERQPSHRHRAPATAAAARGDDGGVVRRDSPRSARLTRRPRGVGARDRGEGDHRRARGDERGGDGGDGGVGRRLDVGRADEGTKWVERTSGSGGYRSSYGGASGTWM